MKKITTGEAAHNFSTLTNMVDKEKIVTITNHGKDRYVIMTMDKYETQGDFEKEMREKAKEGLFLKEGERLWHIKTKGRTTITQLNYEDGELEYYKIITLPETSVSYTEDNPIIVNIEKKGKIQVTIEEADFYDNDKIREIEKDFETKEVTEAKFTGFEMFIN